MNSNYQDDIWNDNDDQYNNNNSNKGIIIIAIVCFIVISCLGLLLKSKIKAKIDTEHRERINVAFQQVTSKISDIAQFATSEYKYSKTGLVVHHYMFSDATLEIRVDGIIKEGFEFGDIHSEIDIDNKVITIDLPRAIQISHEHNTIRGIETTSIMRYTVQPSDIEAVERELIQDAEYEAENDGLIERAYNNAENIIGGLFESSELLKGFQLVFNNKYLS